MAASRSDPLLGRAFGGVVLRSDHMPGPASYDADGQRYVFIAAATDAAAYALDVETVKTRPPDAVAALFERSGETRPFFHAWTELEVIAKISNMPCHVLLRDGCALARAGRQVTVLRCDGPAHWIAVGRKAA